MSQTERSRIRKIIQSILRWFRLANPREPESPQDPYAYAPVPAPKRPRPSGRSTAAVAELPEE